MVCNSLTYIEARCSWGQKTLLKKAIGWSCCIRIAPIADLEALVSSVKGVEKFHKANTEAWVIACLRSSFWSKDVNGEAMEAYPMINFL